MYHYYCVYGYVQSSCVTVNPFTARFSSNRTEKFTYDVLWFGPDSCHGQAGLHNTRQTRYSILNIFTQRSVTVMQLELE